MFKRPPTSRDRLQEALSVLGYKSLDAHDLMEAWLQYLPTEIPVAPASAVTTRRAKTVTQRRRSKALALT
jgi:hypothetical protein